MHTPTTLRTHTRYGALLALALAACSPSAAPSDASADASVALDAFDPTTGPDDAALPRRDARADAPMAPVLDPHTFDCTRESPLPTRTSTVPLSCALDRNCRTPMVSAHRGAGGELGRIAPEDTLAAYRAAIVLGVDFVETDPRPTADGVMVNVHDTTVDRTTFGTGEVSAMTLAQVQSLRLRAERFAGDFSCERIPTLRAILETCRGRVVVLVDANKTDRVDLLVQAIRDADAIDWAVFDTSSLDKIDRALAMEPRLHIMNRPDSVEAIEPELRHFAAHPPVIVELRANHVAMGAPIVHSMGSRVFTDLFADDVLVRLNGDSSGYARYLDQGLDIVQTDLPDVVLGVLRARR